MFYLWAELFVMLLIILASAAIFTNAIEHLGQELGISAGVTGSVFAAVATALPETSIPILAMIAGTKDRHVNEEISVGAILGAPLMLSTLSLFLVSLFALRKRRLSGRIKPEQTGYQRDLNFFLMAFFFAGVALYIPHTDIILRAGLSAVLIVIYIIYLYLTFKDSSRLVSDGHGVMIDEPMFLSRFGLKYSRMLIYIQLIFGLVLLVLGARGFIYGVEHISKEMHISALLLSLLIVPIATELPEKVNSILWIKQNKDTLSIGNITGAMVFQGTLLPALGIMLTPWEPSKNVIYGILVAFVAAVWLRLIANKKGIPLPAFFVNGLLYITYLCIAITTNS